MSKESNAPVYASIGANVVISSSKFVAGAITQSSAMLAEGVHSFIDIADGALLLVGRHQSRKPADELHPFGHGKALYFWTLIVALLFFALGGGISLYEGVHELLHPEPLKDPTWSYIVLAVAALFDGVSFFVALKHFRRTTRGRTWLLTAEESKDPTLFTLVLEDTGDIMGVGIAFLAVFLSHKLNAPWIDAVGSILIGLLLATIAVFLVRESKKLLVGESADPALVRRVRSIAEADTAVLRVHRLMTMHLGPSTVLAVLEVDFEPSTSVGIGNAITRLDASIKQACPMIKHVFIEAQSLQRHG